MKRNFSFKEGMVLDSFSSLEVREAAIAPGIFFRKRNQILLFFFKQFPGDCIFCLVLVFFFCFFFSGGGGGLPSKPRTGGFVIE